MELHLLENNDYAGNAGIIQLRQLQQLLSKALAQEDWNSVRRLDKRCGIVMDRVIAAHNAGDKVLIQALGELKGVYFDLLKQSKCEDAAMTY